MELTAEKESTTGLSFSRVLEKLKSGARIQRVGWNGKGMFIYLNRGSVDRTGDDQSHIDGIPSYIFDSGDTGTVTRYPNINMKAATGATVTGWLVSQTDMLAEDWQIVE